MDVIGSDRDHLLGLLALQMDFVSRDDLRDALRAWKADPARPLADLLVDRGAIPRSRVVLLHSLVEDHLSVHSSRRSAADPGATSADDPGPSSKFRDDLHRALSDGQPAADPPTVGTVDHSDELATSDEIEVEAGPATEAATGIGLDDSPRTVVDNDDGRTEDPGRTSVTLPRPSGLPLSRPVKPRPKAEVDTTVGAVRYAILRHHAKGGLGDVFLARDTELNREVALKEIQERHADRLDSRQRFLVEAEITGGLEHPGIVPVYGLGKYPDGRPYYAMRFIRGDTLRDAIDHFHEADLDGDRDPGERTLALRELLGRFVDVCNAIGYAHSRGILHRDIKPGNIMLGNFGETLVVDWGLAKSIEAPDLASTSEKPLVSRSGGGSSPTMLGSAVGTPQFMSPEQAAGRLDRPRPDGATSTASGRPCTALLDRPALPFGKSDVGDRPPHKVERGDFAAAPGRPTRGSPGGSRRSA